MKVASLYLIVVLEVMTLISVQGQTIGGNAAFSFVNNSVAAQTTALGGINITNQSQDVSLIYGNPGLLRDTMNAQVAADFNSYYNGIKNYYAVGAYYLKKMHASIAASINYIDYGSTPQTDPSGNILGNLIANDYVVQLITSAKYEQNWYYGGAIKFINSTYGIYKSNAIALDAGVNFLDNSGLWQIGLVVRNIGTQIKSYVSEKEDIPFDAQLGVSKKLKKVPFQFSLTIHHLHQFDIRYMDTLYQLANSSSSFTRIVDHFIFSAQYIIGNKVELTMGYNFLRRDELKILSAGNGFTGLSFGVAALFNKLQIHYARAYYQSNDAYNQFGVNVNLARNAF